MRRNFLTRRIFCPISLQVLTNTYPFLSLHTYFEMNVYRCKCPYYHEWSIIIIYICGLLFRVVDNEFGSNHIYKQDDSLNPNRSRYRLLWQAAYAAIVSTIRQNKIVRKEWERLVLHNYLLSNIL